MSRYRKPRKVLVRATSYDRRGRIIATATNSYTKSHTFQAKISKMVGCPEKIFLHAEILCLLKSRGRKIHKVFVERYDYMGNPKNAAPCSGCQLALKLAKVKLVEFTMG